MKKLRLSADALMVESFEPAPATEPLRGTVRAHGTRDPQECTNYGMTCTTSAAPGELCPCIMLSNETCGSNLQCGCEPTPYC